MVNTILTSLGMWALQIPGVGLMSLFVFVCGFIPIAGVIISTVPVGFVALTEYGFTKVGAVGPGRGGVERAHRPLGTAVLGMHASGVAAARPLTPPPAPAPRPVAAPCSWRWSS